MNRNRLKRRLREALRLDVLHLGAAVDLIVRASPRAYDLTFASIRREVGDGVARLLKQEPACDPS